MFLGAPERQTIRLELRDGSLYLSELLQWIEDMAIIIGSRYFADSGKDGVIAIVPTLSRVYRAVRSTWDLVEPAALRSTGLPVGLSAPRVRFVLHKLITQLFQLLELTSSFRRDFAAEELLEPVPPTAMAAPRAGLS